MAAEGYCPPGSLPQLTEDDKREVAGTVIDGDIPIYYVAPPGVCALPLPPPLLLPGPPSLPLPFSFPLSLRLCERGSSFLTYLSLCPAECVTTKAIVVIYDVFGFSGGRIKGCCDALAAAGFHVAMPDVYKGTDIAAEGGFGNEKAMAWLKGCAFPASRNTRCHASSCSCDRRYRVY